MVSNEPINGTCTYPDYIECRKMLKAGTYTDLGNKEHCFVLCRMPEIKEMKSEDVFEKKKKKPFYWGLKSKKELRRQDIKG